MSLMFVCENSGGTKLKKVPIDRLSRLKNPRLVFLDNGIQLHAEFRYRSGCWTLTAGGMCEVWPFTTHDDLLNLTRAIQQASL